MNRRHFLETCCSGMGGLALSSLLSSAARAQERKPLEIDPLRPLTPRRPMLPPRAQRIIFLYQYGGPTQAHTRAHKPLPPQPHANPVPAEIKAKKAKGGARSNASHDKSMPGPGGW